MPSSMPNRHSGLALRQRLQEADFWAATHTPIADEADAQEAILIRERLPRLDPMPEADRENLSNLLLWCFERDIPLVKTGSRVIGGATNESDWDYVIKKTFGRLLPDGWEAGGSFGEGSGRDTESYRLGRLNLMVAHSDSTFKYWQEATFIAKKMGLTNKPDRIALFDSVFEDADNGYSYLLDASNPTEESADGPF